MRGQFKVTPCVHGNNKYLVTGYTNGRRTRSFFPTRTEAQTWAEQKNIELQNFGHELAEMSTGLRAEAITCMERLAPFGITLTQITDAWLDQNNWRAKSVLVKDGIASFFADIDRKLAANETSFRHYETLRCCVKKLLPDFSARHLCDLSPEILNKWLISQPVGLITRNNIRRNLSVFFTFAVDQIWIAQNPISKVKAANTKRIKAAKKVCIYTPEQASSILFQADHDLVPFFAIGMFAGLRSSEIERLGWHHILWDERLIDVEAGNTKTAKERHVPISDNLLAWLAPYRQAQGAVASPRDDVRRKAVRDRAGIPADMDNAMRHSYCSYHFNLHEDAPLTSKNAGHMTPTMLFTNYHRRVKKAECERYFSIMPQEAQNILQVA